MKSTRTLCDVIKAGEDILCKNNIADPAYDSFELMSNIMNIDRSYYFLHGNDEVSDEIYQAYMSCIEKRASHIPLQHITGYADFWRYRFRVNEHVLVPRQDTEILVEEAVKRIVPESTVLDMCTGSGCIIISLALETHFLKGVGVDISSEALKVANANKIALQAENVDFIQSDLFAGLSTDNKCNKYDVIVSNPPYIRTSVIEGLDEEVKTHDPMLALDGHEDGLFFYEAITRQSGAFIKSGGWLIYEIGHDQAEDVSRIMRENGYVNVETVKDLAGLDRVVLGMKQEPET